MKFKIRRKMIIIVILTLIPLSLLKIAEVRFKYIDSIEREMRTSQDYAEAVRTSFMNYIEKRFVMQMAIGEAIVSNPHWDIEDIEQYLNNIMAKEGLNTGYSWIAPDGDVKATTRPVLRGKNFSDREHVKEVISGNDTVIVGLRTCDAGEDAVIIPMAVAVRKGSTLEGIIVSIVDVNDFDNIFPMKRLGEGSTFGVIDNNGKIVYMSDRSFDTFEDRTVHEECPSRKALTGEIVKTYGSNCNNGDNKNMRIDYPIEEIGWSTFVSTPVEVILGSEVAALKKDIAIFLGIFLVSILIAIVLGNRLAHSVSKLAKSAIEIAKGKLEVKTNIKKKDELAEVGQVFDNMVESINEKVKKVEEHNNLKAQFLSTMSHELKTPINIILGCVQLLERIAKYEPLTSKEKINKYIKMQKQNSYRLLRLINNMIDVNKAEIHSIKICPLNDDIVRVVEDITMSITEYTNMKNIQVIFDTEVEEKIMAFDPDMMERIMLNILSNAIKFTEEGGKIEVNVFDGKERVKISVKDSGIGMPEDKLQTIFERFSQIDNTLRRKSEGSGIGLSLVKSLVDMHEGTITVKSEVGKGSEFIIELPVKHVNFKSSESGEKGLSNVERIKIEFSDIYL